MAALPNHSHLRIAQLSRVFNNTTNSYKFYWFWSLLQQAETTRTIPFRNLIVDMVALSWHSVAYYQLSLGSSDQLSDLIQRVLASGDLHAPSKTEEVAAYLHACWNAPNPSSYQKKLISALKKLENYVPYRFLRPFFGRLPKSNMERTIAEHSQATFNVAEEAPIYKINLVQRASNELKSITLHLDWQDYLQQHHKILQEFCWWNLTQFLRSRNPNVPSVSGKILPPYTQKRQLGTAKKFWKKVVEMPSLPPLRCLYTQHPLQATWPIDHFVPWSFVAHDQLWNLLPTPGSINSSKNNRLPDVSYWEPFARLQYAAIQRYYGQYPKALKPLLDYTLLLKTTSIGVATLSEAAFVAALLAELQPLMQQAKNLGFAEAWVWKGEEGFY